ncbi:ryncolin-1-like, partial [Saccostrea cucullata]|uniref:ryncolin-1-like n=1 Tax=Saccostrea cuccullata TaxID=36930 RepID=UPI002ED4AEEF
MSPLHLIVSLFILSFVDSRVPRTHLLIKGHVKESLRKLPWKWRHEKTSYKVKTPLIIGVDVVSSYKLRADSVGIEKIFNTSHFQFRDCAAIMKRTPEVQGKDGVYTIYPDGRTEKRVFCDMTTEGGGWTVIQRRKYGITDFYRSWAEYKRGFGRAETDYWLGNEAIHSLTSLAAEELRIDLEDFSGSKAYARYSKFVIASERDKYKLTVSAYSGNTGDGMKFHNGHVFATKDKDDKGNSAKTYRGGWWYHN